MPTRPRPPAAPVDPRLTADELDVLCRAALLLAAEYRAIREAYEATQARLAAEAREAAEQREPAA